MFGTERKVLSHGTHMCNMKALSLLVQNVEPKLSLLSTDGQRDRQTDRVIPIYPKLRLWGYNYGTLLLVRQ